MIRFFFFLMICRFLAACSPGDSVPDNILPPAKMQDLLWDMMQADEASEFYTQKDSSLNVLASHADWYQQVFQIHKISKEDFKRSLRYFESRPDLLKPIFDSLQKRVEKQQTTPPAHMPVPVRKLKPQ